MHLFFCRVMNCVILFPFWFRDGLFSQVRCPPPAWSTYTSSGPQRIWLPAQCNVVHGVAVSTSWHTWWATYRADKSEGPLLKVLKCAGHSQYASLPVGVQFVALNPAVYLEAVVEVRLGIDAEAGARSTIEDPLDEGMHEGHGAQGRNCEKLVVLFLCTKC